MRVYPSESEFRTVAVPGRIVPVYVELPADLETPLSVYLKLRRVGPSFLLESVEQGEFSGRFSFLGCDTTMLMSVSENQVCTWDFHGRRYIKDIGALDPITCLKEQMQVYEAVDLPGLPGFWGGAVGYLGYDVVRRLERIGKGPPDELGIPESCFMLCRNSIAFDHVAQKMFVVVACLVDGDAGVAYHNARSQLENLVSTISGPVDWVAGHPPAQFCQEEGTFNRTRDDFERAVVKAKKHIAEGDIFQVVLSQRLRRKTWVDAISVYRALRILNPSPYMFCLDLEDFQLVGSSPEMLVRLQGDLAETRPIAGTRRRGTNAVEDKLLVRELQDDPKEKAEHVMLVDLGRNDLGKVCRFGSIEVARFMEVERFSHVNHLVSSVVGRLRQDEDSYSLVRACFPAGTVTGAPKIRAMQIIDDLEPTRRGPYAGAVGYFSFWGSVDTCITIRTIIMKQGEVFMQAGAGVVADSEPAREYEETLEKLAVLRQAVDLAENGLML